LQYLAFDNLNMFHFMLCVGLILFFAWLLLHSFLYSKYNNIIEGLDPAATPTATPTATPMPTPTATPTATPAPTPTAAAAASGQAQIDENTAQIAILKKQIASLIDTATQLTATMKQNETGIKNNTALIQKVMQSQTDSNAKLASMKKAQ
jgi:hypothetical protein